MTEQHVTLSIVSRAMKVVKDSQAVYHDAFVPSDFTLAVGVPTYLTIVNFTSSVHSFDVPDLNLNLVVQPGGTGGAGKSAPSRTTALIEVVRPGPYAWSCEILCGGDGGQWTMSGIEGTVRGKVGFMSGTITAQ